MEKLRPEETTLLVSRKAGIQGQDWCQYDKKYQFYITAFEDDTPFGLSPFPYLSLGILRSEEAFAPIWKYRRKGEMDWPGEGLVSPPICLVTQGKPWLSGPSWPVCSLRGWPAGVWETSQLWHSDSRWSPHKLTTYTPEASEANGICGPLLPSPKHGSQIQRKRHLNYPVLKKNIKQVLYCSSHEGMRTN